MAGERKGKIYEAITYYVFSELLRVPNSFGECLFWNETPEGMSIEPDITLGSGPSEITSAFLITHSGSPKDSSRKVWRNLGELSELKTCFTTNPRVFAVTFGRIKESLSPLQDSAFDGHLHVIDQPYANTLNSVVNAVLKKTWKGKEQLSNVVSDVISGSTTFKDSVSAFADDLTDCFVVKGAVPQDQIWKLHRQRKVPCPRKSRLTTVRRGYAKLLILPSFDIANDLWGKRERVKNCPVYLHRLGMVKKTIGGFVAQDDEIEGIFDCLSLKQIKSLMDAPIGEKTKSFVNTLRSDSQIGEIANFFGSQRDRYADGELLFTDAADLSENPDALVDREASSDWPPDKVWLIDYLIEVIRTSTGKANGYGYAQLAAEVADPKGAAGGFDEGVRLFLQSPWGHLSEWIDREEGEMPTPVLQAICSVISARIGKMSESEWSLFVTGAANNYLTNILETKLAHRGIDPLRILLEAAVGKVDRGRIRTCFAEHADLGGQAGKIEGAIVQHTLLKWQSCTDSGRDHKKKELCGQAIGLRYAWDGNGFVQRDGIKKLILVVDGTWRQEDLNALFRAGWDEIFYPDEMAKLADAIV